MISLKSSIGEANEPSQANSETPAKQGNIFGQTLSAGQTVKTKKVQYIQAKNRKKAYLRLGISFAALVLYAVFFLYDNTAAYLKAPSEIADRQAQIKEYEDIIVPSLQKTKDLHKAAYDQEFEDTIQALETVFPTEIDKLGIVRLFESFATEVAANYPPFEFTSINFSNPQEKDGYRIIPVSTSIHSSLVGFDKFLSLVDRSGYIYSGEGDKRNLIDKKIRLMSISNISVKYRGVDQATGKDQGVDFSVKLNIYSRTPKVSGN